jgi:hypothetical protein
MEEEHIGTAKIKTYIKITRITIVICWISLFAFWAIKLFGGNFFEIAVQNENFVKFSEKVETTWLKYLVSFITIAIAKYLTFGAICQKFYFKGKQLIFVIFGIVSIWAVANFLPLGFLNFSSWYGYLIFVLASIIYQKGWKKTFGILSIVFELLFALVSMQVRNLPIEIMSNYLIAAIFIFDLYLMLALYYLYSNLINLKKEIK